jgi:hypothetical protein
MPPDKPILLVISYADDHQTVPDSPHLPYSFKNMLGDSSWLKRAPKSVPVTRHGLYSTLLYPPANSMAPRKSGASKDGEI